MKSVRDLSSRVNELSRNSAENLLEIGLAFIDAKTQLSPDEHKQFLKETHYEKNTSTVRKWERIGQSYVRLKSISNLLPPVFTSLYKLSSLSADELNVLIKNKIIRPSVTTAEIDEELNKTTSKMSALFVKLEFDSATDADTIVEILDSLSPFNPACRVKMNAEIEEFIETNKV